jgi:DNA repair exonuclease SbcCD nuclease subunit
MALILSDKIGCFSDIHIGLGQDSKQWHDIALNFAKWASEVYKSKGIDTIIIPGDIFHNRSEIGVNTLAVAKKFFDYFKGFKIFISSGNHDCFYKDNSSVNSISILDGWNNINIIDKNPVIIETTHNDIVLVPWGTLFEDIPETNGIIFGHFEISSFYMNSYKVCEHGMESKDLFKKAPLIISGHFHKKDDRKYDNGRIVYLGSPYQHNFGDVGDARGIYILDLEKNELEFIENNLSPKHLKLSTKAFIENPESINSETLKQQLENNIISLIVDSEIDQEELALLTSKLNSIAPLSFRTDYISDNTNPTTTDDTKEIDSGDLLKDIEEFVNTLTIENKKEVVEYLTETYNLLSK